MAYSCHVPPGRTETIRLFHFCQERLKADYLITHGDVVRLRRLTRHGPVQIVLVDPLQQSIRCLGSDRAVAVPALSHPCLRAEVRDVVRLAPVILQVGQLLLVASVHGRYLQGAICLTHYQAMLAISAMT
jgi:hypothetical protein